MGAATPESVVTTARAGAILVVTVNNPPVNALGVAVRQGLAAAMAQAQADSAVAGVLLMGAGKAFIAGADIREFGKPPVPPALPEVCRAIEGSDKPVVAVLHGAALGGGLEVALSAHYRLALPAATVGLPEVNLGLLPGSGGTQRAPRLMGVQAATAMMLSGQHLKAQAALQAGLVDKLVEGADAQAASGALPEPGLQQPQRRHRAPLRTDCARHHHRRADVRTVRPRRRRVQRPRPLRGMACRNPPVPHRSQTGGSGAANP